MNHPTTSIHQSWNDNAREWIRLIKNEKISSREVTNPAIVQTVLDYQPTSLVDIGCGEGWLCRQLNREGIPVAGADGTAALISYARKESSLPFQHLTYEAICKGAKLLNGPFEAAVLNFCLYQERETSTLLQSIHRQLFKRKLIFIQTIHPAAFIGSDMTYQSQWIEDSWKGLDGSFSSTHRWYFRTFSAWIQLFNESNLNVVEVREPMMPGSDKPASIIFVLS